MSGRVVVDREALGRLLLTASEAAARCRDASLARAVAEFAASTTAAPAPRPRAYLSVDEAADELGVSTRTIRRRVADGSLPHMRLGRRLLVARTSHQRPGADTAKADTSVSEDAPPDPTAEVSGGP